MNMHIVLAENELLKKQLSNEKEENKKLLKINETLQSKINSLKQKESRNV